MDVVLNFFDEHVFDSVYASLVPAVVPTAAAVARGAGLTIFPSNGSYLPMDPSPSRWASLLSFLPGAKDAIAGTPFLSASSSASTFATTTLPGVSAWSRDYIPRQLLSLSIITLLGAYALYFIFATASYFYIFDHRMMKHPKFLKNQVRMEIESSCMAVPAITIMTLPWFMAEIHGYTKLYDDVEQYGWLWLIASVPVFLLVTDLAVYWIHRLEHHPALYKHVHKPHHKWRIPTPFAALAFHPVDGYLQSLPYHIIISVLPFHRYLYLGLFVGVQLWTVLIHDSDLIVGHPLEKYINGPAHHTLHHMYFTVNYGQYFTWADRAGGSYRQPQTSDDPLLEVLQLEADAKAKLEAKKAL